MYLTVQPTVSSGTNVYRALAQLDVVLTLVCVGTL
jgi:hypothetical protein